MVCLCLMAREGSIRVWLLLGAPNMHMIFGLSFARQGHVMWMHVHRRIHYGNVESTGCVGVGTCVDHEFIDK